MRYAKAIVAVVTAGLLAFQTAVPMSTGAHGWVTVVLAMLGAFGVFMVPNLPPEPPPVPPRATGVVTAPAGFFDQPVKPPTIAPPVPGRYPPTGYTIMTPPKEDQP